MRVVEDNPEHDRRIFYVQDGFPGEIHIFSGKVVSAVKAARLVCENRRPWLTVQRTSSSAKGAGECGCRRCWLAKAAARFLTEAAPKRRGSDDAYVARMSRAVLPKSAGADCLAVRAARRARAAVDTRGDRRRSTRHRGKAVGLFRARNCGIAARSRAQKAETSACILNIAFCRRWRAGGRVTRMQADLRFGGIFTVSASDHTGIPAMQNLGSHLLAMHAFAAPRSSIGEIRCAYETANQRMVWLDSGKRRVETIDLLQQQRAHHSEIPGAIRTQHGWSGISD